MVILRYGHVTFNTFVRHTPTMQLLQRLLFIFILLQGLSSAVSAITISGKVTDENSQPVPFASVYIKGTTTGTTTNIEGAYSLELKPGKYELVFKFIGYKQHIEPIDVGLQHITLNVQLMPEAVSLKEVTIKANEDPAYEVIRQAQKKRKFYLNQVEAYSCDVYIKGVQRVTKYPKKILGQEIDVEGQIDTATGIVYLSESVSKFNFKQPDKIKEEMVSSKVSGDNKAFSYNEASDMLFNFYENVIEVDALSERGFISPIANTALLSYRYHLLGTFFENGQMINKIEVIPIRKSDPVFRGVIYIIEGSWRIHSLDLVLTKDAQIDFVDTLHVNQVHVPVDKDVWMPIMNKFTFDFGFLGIKGNGMYVGVNSNYVLDPDFPKNYFTGEVMKVTDEANKKDTAYWKDTRPVPLTQEEENDYHKRDSLQRIRESKPYLDSLDRKFNKFKFSNLFFGYTYSNRYKKRSLSISPLIENVGFNTVQGLNAELTVSYNKSYEPTKRSLSFSVEGGYGFADKKPFGGVSAYYSYKPVKFAYIDIRGGQTVEQLNRKEPISGLVNTVYTLLNEQNFMKLFRNSFFGVTHRIEVINGVMLTATAEYSDRMPLINHSDFKLVDKADREYTSNNPLDPEHNTYLFPRNQSMDLSVSVRLRYKQRYYTRPNEKFIIGSKYPALTIAYRKAIPGIFGSDMNFDRVKISVDDKLNLKMFGNSQYSVSYVHHLNTKRMSFIDYYHFMGNRTLWSDFDLDRFNLLDYYTYSTNGSCLEAHFQHNFAGFILNKIPLVRKLKMQELVSVHYLNSDRSGQYMELSVGVQRLVARIDFVTSFTENKKAGAGIRFGLEF
jgi:hypothetical protein